MFLLSAITFLSFLFGFACPPLWVITFFAVRQIIRIGRARHLEMHRAAQLERHKVYMSWSK